MLMQGYAQTFTLQGKVTDDQNNPVELATVAVVQQGRMTMTNLKGEFSIQLLSADSVVVRFSMVGYKTKTRVLRNPKGRQTLLIQLMDDTTIDEVVVTEQVRPVQRRTRRLPSRQPRPSLQRNQSPSWKLRQI